MAIAHEQEMKALVQEQRAKVVEAEAAVPLALSEALKKGNIGALDYYQLQNVLADTQMRESISRAGSKPEAPIAEKK